MTQIQQVTPEVDLSQEFASRASSATEARRWVREEAERVGLGHRRRILELLATELASNAIMHVGEPFTVRFVFDGHVVRVEVADSSTEIPRDSGAALTAPSGRGFTLVRRLSRRSGIDVHPDGKTVWFEIDAFRQFTNREDTDNGAA